jgi:nucleoside-diphosphate-sugar epimerase
MGKHVVLGAGQIGSMVARTLAERGEDVVLVRRSAAPSPVPGVEVVRGDLSDAAFARSVGRGADVVYQCTNPAYHRWAAELLPNLEGAILCAKENGARLVVLDNLYAYGDTGAEPRHEGSPMKPCSKKGELRRLYAERAMAARKGELRVTLVRASDFFGPGVEQSVLGERGLTRMLAKKSVEVLGDPEIVHAYSYGPDVAATLVRVAELAGMPEVVHVPTLPARSTRAYVDAMAAALGVPAKTMRAPGWLLSAMGLFDPPMGELVEMLYQFEAPFLYDDTRSRALLGMEPTPFDAQIAATAEWARARWAPGAAKAA